MCIKLTWCYNISLIAMNTIILNYLIFFSFNNIWIERQAKKFSLSRNSNVFYRLFLNKEPNFEFFKDQNVPVLVRSTAVLTQRQKQIIIFLYVRDPVRKTNAPGCFLLEEAYGCGKKLECYRGSIVFKDEINIFIQKSNRS